MDLLKLNVFLLLMVSFSMYGPFMTSQVMDYINDKAARGINEGILIFIVILLITFLGNVWMSQIFYRFTILGFDLLNILTMMIYTKSLRYPTLSQKKFGVSDIINYSQVDAERMSYMGYQLSALLFTPLQLTIGIFLMYHFIGSSFLAGVIMMILMMSMTYFIGKKTLKLNQEVLKAKDARMKITQEMLDIIRFIKITAMEKYFFNKLNVAREKQIQLYKKKGFLQVVMIFFYWLNCPLILAATFGTYVYRGFQMNSTVAFTTIMIFSILQYPIRALPTSISEVIQMFASLKRIEKYLLAKEMSTSLVTNISDPQCPYAIKIENGIFYWGVEDKEKEKKEKEEKEEKEKNEGKKENKKEKVKEKEKEKEKQQSKSKLKEKIDVIEGGQHESEKNSQKDAEDIIIIETEVTEGDVQKVKYLRALKDVNTTIQKGKFTIVLGEIGSGKSSLLLAILNQMRVDENSRIVINGGVAYAAQKPWIMSCTVRDNVIFSLPYEAEKFQKIVHYACLEKDLKILAKGDLTQIGENGVNLSGGQKARVSLARALYSQKDIYLFDDVLSAVDVHVGEFIMRQTILSFLKGRTVIMPTHAVKFAEFADDIIVMKKGRIAVKGHYRDICDTVEFRDILLKEEEKSQKKEQKKDDEDAKIEAELNMLKEVLDKKQKSQAKADENVQLVEQNINERIVQELMIPQDQVKGKIDMKIFKEYLKLNGGIRFGVLVSFVMFCWVICTTFASIQMERWCEDPLDRNYDLYVYLGLSIASNIFIFIRAYSLILSGAKQGQTVHKKMIKSLLYASLTKFYNRVPIGRIINRLGKDLRELDEAIGYVIGGLLVCFFQMVGTITICLYSSTPYIVIPIGLITYLCIKLKNYYMRTQREVARFQKSTNSPIVSGFVSVINGLSTLRAYQKEEDFTVKQFERIDKNKRVKITKEGLESWFALTLSYFSLLVSMCAIGYNIFSENTNSSLAGLLMNFALRFSDDIISTTLSWAYFETKIVSLERIYNFIRLQPEPDYVEYCKEWRTKEEGAKNIIERGNIQFKNFSSKYRSGLPNVLKKINFTIKAGEKVGIVGRTGAGKTTIINALLRITDISEGDILIDDKSIREYPLKDLRNSITMIDQEPVLINSTFRENLDVTKFYSDEQLWAILKECNLADTITEKEGLEGTVSNDSLSVGEKQLLCICRAFLKKSRLVLIDEATANIDIKNDDLIQRVIATKFKESTVLTIAHRLTTLKNSDKIMVLDQGSVVEWGSPSELESIEGGIYAEMVKKNASEFLV